MISHRLRPIACIFFFILLTLPVAVTANVVEGGFSVNDTIITAPGTIRFSSIVPDASLWEWDFGDGTSSDEEAPLHTYQDPGWYSVGLIAYTPEGTERFTADRVILVVDPVCLREVPGTYDSIQAAIDAAEEGDTVLVEAGRYCESLTLTTPITLIGDEKEGQVPLIDAEWSGTPITVTGKGCAVYHFQVANPDRDGAAAAIDGDGIELFDVVAFTERAIDRTGFLIQNSGAVSLRRVAATGVDTGAAILNSTHITLNTGAITGSGTDGIVLDNATSVEVVDIDIADSGRYGIRLSSATACRITGNTIDTSGDTGVVCEDSSDNVIYLNSFLNNRITLRSIDSRNRWNALDPVPYQFNGTAMCAPLGNYWDEFASVDADKNGILDKPYLVAPYNTDTNPLISPWDRELHAIGQETGQLAEPPVTCPEDTSAPQADIVEESLTPAGEKSGTIASWMGIDPAILIAIGAMVGALAAGTVWMRSKRSQVSEESDSHESTSQIDHDHLPDLEKEAPPTEERDVTEEDESGMSAATEDGGEPKTTLDREEFDTAVNLALELAHKDQGKEAVQFLYWKMMNLLAEHHNIENPWSLTPREILLRSTGKDTESGDLKEFCNIYNYLRYSGTNPTEEDILALARAYARIMESIENTT